MSKHSHAIVLVIAALLPSATFADDPPAPPPPRRVNPQDRPAVRLLFRSWNLPIRPRHLIGNIYYVGAAGVSSFLITTPTGHILIDTGFEETVPLIQKSVTDLGFKTTDIKIMLSSHAHIDHVGGHSAMQKLTGAMIVASAADGHVMETGGQDDFSPFPKEMMRYTPIKPDRIVGEGDTVTLGDITLTAHLTPGHTKGATSWAMDIIEEDKQLHVVFFSSATIVEGTKLLGNADYPTIVEDFRSTFNKVRDLPCDVYFGPHGDQFVMTPKLARLDRGDKPNPFIDPQGWKRLIADAERNFNRQLASETAAQKK